MGVGFNVGVFEYVGEDKFLESEVEDISLDAFLVFSFQVVNVESQVVVSLLELSELDEFGTP